MTYEELIQRGARPLANGWLIISGDLAAAINQEQKQSVALKKNLEDGFTQYFSGKD